MSITFSSQKIFLSYQFIINVFAWLFYRNDVLFSIVSVPKTIHIVKVFFFFFFFFFFTIALPSGFYYEKTELLSQEVFSAMLCIFFKSACIKSASRHSVIHVFFFIKIPPHYCRRSRLWSMTQNRPLLGNALFSLAVRATLLTALKWAWYRVSKN